MKLVVHDSWIHSKVKETKPLRMCARGCGSYARNSLSKYCLDCTEILREENVRLQSKKKYLRSKLRSMVK